MPLCPWAWEHFWWKVQMASMWKESGRNKVLWEPTPPVLAKSM